MKSLLGAKLIVGDRKWRGGELRKGTKEKRPCRSKRIWKREAKTVAEAGRVDEERKFVLCIEFELRIMNLGAHEEKQNAWKNFMAMEKGCPKSRIYGRILFLLLGDQIYRGFIHGD